MDELTFSKDEVTEQLSRTELSYLPLLGAGLTKKEMAEKLCKSEATVNTHIKNIQAKLHAKNGPSVVARAIASGLLKVSLTCFLMVVFTYSDNDDFRRPTRARRAEYQLTQQGISSGA